MDHKQVESKAWSLLDQMDQTATGDATVFKDKAAKDWFETYLLRALDKLRASTYHARNLSNLMEDLSKKAAASAAELAGGPAAPGGWRGVLTENPLPEAAFELDAFLAAARSCIDHLARCLARQIRGRNDKSITSLLEMHDEFGECPFAPLWSNWKDWIRTLQDYRDECVHYRTMRAYGGHRAARAGILTTHTPIRWAIPKSPLADRPDTRDDRINEGLLRGSEDAVPPGLMFKHGLDWVVHPDGRREDCSVQMEYVLEDGYVFAEDFCRSHLERLVQFFYDVLCETERRGFKPQRPPHRDGRSSTSSECGR